MRRAVIAMAVIAIAGGAAGCSTSGPVRGAEARNPGQPAESRRGVTGRWTITSCQVDVTYLDETNTVDHYVPDTDANFQQHVAANPAAGDAGMAVVITLVNNTGGRAALPTGLVVSFTDQNGTAVGSPQTFNNTNGTGYGAAIAEGHGSGEVFSSSTLFSPGQTVAEAPDFAGSVPAQPDLKCHVSRQ